MRPCIVGEQNDPTGELAWSFQFDCLVKDGQGLRVMLGIHCYPALQEVYQKGAKEERQHKLSYTWIFLVVVTLDVSTGDFVVSILVRSDDTKTPLRPPLMSGTHSLPWHSAADDQYSGPFDMLPIVAEDCGVPIRCTLCASSVFPS